MCRKSHRKSRISSTRYKQLQLPFDTSVMCPPLGVHVTEDDLVSAVKDEAGGFYSADGKRLLKYENTNAIAYTVREGTKVICYEAFKYGNNVVKVTIPDSVEYIDERAFYNCTSLIKFVVSKENKYYCSVDGVLFSKDMSVLEHFPQDHTSSHYVIPEGVCAIGHYAFAKCSVLEEITISDNVSYIGKNAFEKCNHLETIIIPNSVCVIDSAAFYFCEELKNITIPNSVGAISERTFMDCYSLQNVELGSHVTHIESFAFMHCFRLRNINIPDSVSAIGTSAFFKCGILRSITIPYNVEKIESDTFHKTYNLLDIFFKNPIPPKCDELPFGWAGVDRDKCVLHVPRGAKELYVKADCWRDFCHIVE